MRVKAEYLVSPHIIEAAHDGEHDNKDRHAQHDPDHRNDGHDRDKRALRPHVLKGQIN